VDIDSAGTIGRVVTGLNPIQQKAFEVSQMMSERIRSNAALLGGDTERMKSYPGTVMDYLRFIRTD